MILRTAFVLIRTVDHEVHDQRQHVLGGIKAGDEQKDEQIAEFAFTQATAVDSLQQFIEKIAPRPQKFAAAPISNELVHKAVHFDEARLQGRRSEEHTSELQSLMRISYAGFCLKKKIAKNNHTTRN